MADENSNTHEDRIARAMNDAEVPKFYANGFVNILGTGDIAAVLERNGQPVAVLNLSYTTAKSLAASLGQIIGRLENVSGREMLTTREIESMLGDREDANGVEST